MLDMLDFLRSCNSASIPLVEKGGVRLVRHADSRWDLDLLVRLGFFDQYQARQNKENFRDAKFIASFMGERGSRSRFMGIFEIAGVSAQTPSLPAGFPHPDMGNGNFYYDLVKVPGFEALENRMIIDWGIGTRSWVQHLKSKAVIELYPEGYSRDFPGYDEVLVHFSELERVVRYPDANRSWQSMLSGVAGVYLITDTASGNQYIGSAHGDGGILGRWTTYVLTKHGGNKQLRELLARDPNRYLSFRYSILRTLPRTATSKEVIAVESYWKEKLGTRAFGLNSN